MKAADTADRAAGMAARVDMADRGVKVAGRAAVVRAGRAAASGNISARKKVCKFCVEKMDFIDYKRADILSQFVQERGKILPRRMTGVCSRHQRWLGEAIKRARNIALAALRGKRGGHAAASATDRACCDARSGCCTQRLPLHPQQHPPLRQPLRLRATPEPTNV